MVDATRTALIDVDMQRCFVEGSPLAAPDGLAVAARINEVAAALRAAGGLVVHTRGWLRPDGSNAGLTREMVPPFIQDLYVAGAETAEIHPAVVVADEDIILDKPRYGAFTGTDLDLVLRSRGIENVVIAGIATNVCCDTTAREAAQREFRVFFLSDGTATKDMNGIPADVLQQATCATLGMVFAKIVTIAEMMQLLDTAEVLVS